MNLLPEQAVKSSNHPREWTGRFSNRYKHFRARSNQTVNWWAISSVNRCYDRWNRTPPSSIQRERCFWPYTEPKELTRSGDPVSGRLPACPSPGGTGRILEWPPSVPFLHWDHHENGHTTQARMKKSINPSHSWSLIWKGAAFWKEPLSFSPVSSAGTWWSKGCQFNRKGSVLRAKTDKLQEMKHYGLHRHFTGGTSVAMWGGVKRFCIWKDGGRASLDGNRKPRIHRRSARYDLHGHGDQSLKPPMKWRKDPSMRPRTALVKPSPTSLRKFFD